MWSWGKNVLLEFLLDDEMMDIAHKHLGEFEKVVSFKEEQPGELICPHLRRLRLPQSQADFAVHSKEARRERSAGKELTKGREHSTTAFVLAKPQRTFSPSCRDTVLCTHQPHSTCTPSTSFWRDVASSGHLHPMGDIRPTLRLKAQSCHPHLGSSPTKMPVMDHVTRL